MESKIKNGQLLVESVLDNNGTFCFNVSDIVAIIPKDQEIVVMTKGGKSTTIKAYISWEDTNKIYHHTIFPAYDKFLFGEYCFDILSDYSIINLDEIVNMNIGGKDNKELNISFDNETTIKVNKNVEDMYEYLNHIRKIRSNARADEAAELQ